MASGNGDRYVTYRQFTTWMLTGGGVMIASMTLMLSIFIGVHSAQPHSGAVTQHEHDRLLNRVVSMDEKIDRLLDR